MVFRPINHPLLNDNLECPHCGDESVTERISLPAYPGDYFDCEACGQSFAPTQEQINRMR
jgi:transcription elongation factor Elf1